MTTDFGLGVALGAIFGVIVAVGAVFAAVSLLSSRLRPYIMPKPPLATVHEQHDAEKEVLRTISETSISKVAEMLESEGLSPKKAREHAQELVRQAEGHGEGGW